MNNLAIRKNIEEAFGSLTFGALDRENTTYRSLEDCVEDGWFPVREDQKHQDLTLVKGTWDFNIGYNDLMIVTLTNPTIGMVQDLVLGQKLAEFYNEDKDLGWCCAPFEALEWNEHRQCFDVVTGS